MKILIDESLPARLRFVLPDHDVVTVPQMGWAGKRNGELVQLIANQFDVFLTVDQNLEYQQNLAGISFAIVVLAAPSNKFETLKSLIPEVQKRLKTIKRGDIVRITSTS